MHFLVFLLSHIFTEIHLRFFLDYFCFSSFTEIHLHNTLEFSFLLYRDASLKVTFLDFDIVFCFLSKEQWLKTRTDWGTFMYPNMCSFVGRGQCARDHELMLVRLTWMCRLHWVVCLRPHKVACLRLESSEGTCLLLTLQLIKPLKPNKKNLLLMWILFLIVFQKAPMTPPYFLTMFNMLLCMFGKKMYIYLLLHYIYFILIELRLKLIYLFL